MKYLITAVLAVVASVGVGANRARAQSVGRAILPDPAWDCGMPEGIPPPEAGSPMLEIEIPLDRAAEIGRTQYGDRRVAVGLEGSVRGNRLAAAVMPGALDLEVALSNGTIEIEQIFVLRLADGSYVYVRNAGAGVDANDVRVVVDFEAPNGGQHAWLNTGKFVARRELNASAKTLALHVYDVSSVDVDPTDGVKITKPAGVPAQPWEYRTKAEGEQPGELLIEENVTLAPGQSVGPSKRGNRNIIPITGGKLEGRISGKVLMGGADYQNLTPPATIDAHYLWETDDGEIVIVRNGGSFGSLVPTFEARADGPHAFLNTGRFLSSNPGVGQGGVSLKFYESTPKR